MSRKSKSDIDDDFAYEDKQAKQKQEELTEPVLLLRGALARVVRRMLRDFEPMQLEHLVLDRDNADGIYETVLPEEDWYLLSMLVGWEHAFNGKLEQLMREAKLPKAKREVVYKALCQEPVDEDEEVGQDIPLASEVNLIRSVVYCVVEETSGVRKKQKRVTRVYTMYMQEMTQAIEAQFELDE